jgi:hypothetical protein
VTRILDLFGDQLAGLRGEALHAAIKQAEGRALVAEVIGSAPPLLAGTSNVELVAAFGADLILLNMVDPRASGPLVTGFEAVDPAPDGFVGLSRLLGRPVGLNLEPDLESVPQGLRATPESAAAAFEGGASFVVVTANPGRGATISHLADAVATVRAAAPDLRCVAGKMHQAGATERLGPEVAGRLLDAGAQGVLVPLPGTVPGVAESTAAAMVDAAHTYGALAIGTLGTSQEGADAQTLRLLALTAKRVGVDLHHIGDAGFTGVANPENVYTYAVAIRGVRHTWNRMARGVRASWNDRRTA